MCLVKVLVYSRWLKVFVEWLKWFMNKDVCLYGKGIGWKERKERRELIYIKGL